MAPKKAPPKKKDGGGDERNFELENFMMLKKIEVLQQRISLKELHISQSGKNKEELDARIFALQKAFAVGSERARDVTSEMSRQFTEMNDSFNERITELEGQVKASREAIGEVQKELDRTRISKDEVIANKDQEIKTLSLKMEAMAFEFADMLKGRRLLSLLMLLETLDRMSQRIEVTHAGWGRDVIDFDKAAGTVSSSNDQS